MLVGWAHNTNAVVGRISNIHVASAVQSNANRDEKLRIRPISVSKATKSVTSKRAQSPIWAHNMNALIISNIHVAGTVNDNTLRLVKPLPGSFIVSNECRHIVHRFTV